MFDVETVNLQLEGDDRPWSRLLDLGSDEIVEICLVNRKASERLAIDLRRLGLEATVRDGIALNITAPEFWIVVGRLADLVTIGLPAVHYYLKTDRGKRLRALLSNSRGRKELHPAFSLEALARWCDNEFGRTGSDKAQDVAPAWRFDPDAIKARRLPAGLIALEVYEEVSARVLLLVSDGEQVQWLSDRVQSGASTSIRRASS